MGVMPVGGVEGSGKLGHTDVMNLKVIESSMNKLMALK